MIQRSSAVPAKSPQGGNEREARGEGFSFPEDSVFFPEEGQRFQRKTEPPRRKPSERRAAATAAAERRKLEKEEKGIVEKTKE